MNFRTTYVLFALLLALLLSVVIGLLITGGPDTGGYVLNSLQEAGLQPDDINSVMIDVTTPDGDDQTLVFERATETKRWRLTKPYPARVDQATVNDLIRDLMNARIDPEINIAGGLAANGLANPTVKVTLRHGEDTSTWVKVGNVSTGGADGEVFLLSADNPDEPIAVRRRSITALFRPLSKVPPSPEANQYVRRIVDFRPLNLLGEGFPRPETVQRLELGEGEQKITLTQQDGWEFIEPKGYGRAASSAGIPEDGGLNDVGKLLNAAFAVRATNADSFIENPSPSRLKEFGLTPESEGALRIRIVRSEGEDRDQTLLVGKPVDGADNQVYARLEDSSAVVKVPADNVKQIRAVLKNPNSIRDRSLVDVAVPRIDVMQIERGPTDIELYQFGGPIGWAMFSGTDIGQKANPRMIQPILSTINNPALIREFVDGKSDSETGFDKPQVTVKLWVDGIKSRPDFSSEELKKPEHTGDPTVTLIFGKSQADRVFVRRVQDGTQTDALVPLQMLDLVSKSRLDFRDPSLPEFDFTRATKLTFNRGEEEYVITRAKNGPADPAQATWEINSPESLKGRYADSTQVGRILSKLGSIQARKLIDDQPDEGTLERLGLKPSAIRTRATVTLGEGDMAEQRVYDFGEEDAQDGTIYARMDEKSLVFTVDPTTVDPIREGTIRDSKVLVIDPGSIQKLKVEGWAKEFSPPTLEFELKSPGGWTPIEMTFPVNQRIVNDLVGALNPLRAVSFLDGGEKPEYQLTKEKGALIITITLEADEEPVTLKVGGQAESPDQLYAETSRAPGEVFIIPAGPFQAIKERSSIFRRE